MIDNPSAPNIKDLCSGFSIWARDRSGKLMRKGYLPFILGGIAILLFVSWWSRPNTKSAIEHVIAEDKRFSREEIGVLAVDATASQRAAAIRRYCVRAEHQPMADCPARFQLAYREHVRSWSEAADAVRVLPDGLLDGIWIGLVNSITRGESDGGASRLETSLANAFTRVQTSWHEVARIAAEYEIAPTQ